jgi:phosphoribosylglycinamide formyltransferase-1
MRAILSACARGEVDARPAVVISNNSRSPALEHARNAGVPAFHLSAMTAGGESEVDEQICKTLQDHRVNLIVLAGYMRKVGPRTLAAFPRRIVNIHPGLLPKFGGQGMYGIRVHKAVLDAGERETGVTVHLVTPEYDEGPFLAQERVRVEPSDTPETLAVRVLKVEHWLYSQVLQRLAAGEIPFG